MDPVVIGFDVMFPLLVEHHGICCVIHACGLRDIPSQMRLIETMEDLFNYTDAELDNMMADRNSERSPAVQRVQMGLARTKSLKAVTHWARKKLHDGAHCRLLLQPLLNMSPD